MIELEKVNCFVVNHECLVLLKSMACINNFKAGEEKKKYQKHKKDVIRLIDNFEGKISPLDITRSIREDMSEFLSLFIDGMSSRESKEILGRNVDARLSVFEFFNEAFDVELTKEQDLEIEFE